MNYLISESQMQVIITESLKERFGDNMRQLNEITKKVIDDVQTVYKLNFKFLLTWGASIGGMIGPLKNWVEGNIPNLTEYEVSLLVLGAVAQFYYDNDRKLKNLYKKISDKGLSSEFEVVQIKADEIRRAFVDFISMLAITSTSMINTMSYAFILPILEDLYHLSIGADNTQTLIQLIGKRLVSSGAMVVTGSVLSNLIKKMIQKFQEKR
jgi:hypothetical protein